MADTYELRHTGEQVDTAVDTAHSHENKIVLDKFGEKEGQPIYNDKPIKGEPGTTPHIGDNDNWYIDNVDTGIKAKGEDGSPGAPGKNGLDGERGETGPIGPQGEPGPKGDPGAIGPQGERGVKGEPGEKGETGERGPQGIQGDPGPQGERGEQGSRGEKGEPGIQGEKGDKGDIGTGVSILGSYNTPEELYAEHPTGNIGDGYLIDGNLYVWNGNSGAWLNVGNIKGPQGAPGKSAYESAVEGGYSGTEAGFYMDLAAIGGLADAIISITGV